MSIAETSRSELARCYGSLDNGSMLDEREREGQGHSNET